VPDEPPLDHAAVRAIVVGILLAMMLSALEQTIVGPALPTIGRALDDLENLSWVVTAYLLAATVATPLAGKLSDIYGRRTVMLISIGIFVVGSVACALAPNMATLILARAVQGLGGGGILPLAQTIIADLVPPRQRARYQSYTSVMFMAASVAGPVIGGFFAEHLHWSLIFWINLPLGLVAFAMTNSVLRRLPRHDRPHRLDVMGALLMVGAALLAMLALTWGGNRLPWTSPGILALAAGSAVLWLLFAVRLRRAPEPFIPLAVMRNRVVRTATIAAFCVIGTITALSIFVPLYLELVLLLSASASGSVLIGFMAGTVVGSLAAGRLLGRVSHYKRLPIAGLCVAIGALAALAASPAGLSLAAVALIVAIVGLGVGPMYPLTTVVIQNVVLPHQFGIATGLLNFFRLLGGAFLVAGFGAILFGGIGTALHDPEAVKRLATAVAPDIVAAFRWVFMAAAAVLAVGLAFLLAMEERPLRGTVTVPLSPAAPVE
jgi:EmrB/QacA subfamily drug resistance transporter